ncbi:Retinoid-inducible serine carboxypeptidase [Bagarius yarrelli]|uniref:Carboxypeptidase n=1 Tax=Bagarius yarrelli TaxID=175774 RepID=A0A556TVN9_BAGYA|nr:Retinoid-inducible serine carboxypeptidase [Bagarius yarrelli]
MARYCISVFLVTTLLFTACFNAVSGKEAWGYVDVRDGAHMFWWLYYANSSSASFQDLPLVMWLQGGPGGSSCGFGNFAEIGPLDTALQPRETSWVNAASVLFVDNPVGTGYSYTDSYDALTKDVAMVASDMMVLLKHFFSKKPEFQNIPFYIFSESYGGKMAAAISFELAKSLLDDFGLNEVTRAAKEVQKAVEQEQYDKATQLWSIAENVVEQNTNGVNFYNILTPSSDLLKSSTAHEDYLSALNRRHVRPLHGQSLDALMNGPIREKLGIIPKNVTWGGVNVTVYNGQLDLIVDTMGQELWVKKLKWDGLQKFNQMKWTALEDPQLTGQTGAFYKTYKNFAFYWILKAGHMIPSDQGSMALRMLRMVTLQE